MNSLNRSSRRAPASSKHVYSGIEYETRPGDTSQDIAFNVSGDGRRAVKEVMNVSIKKRKILPSDLVDSYGEWVPLPGEPWEEGGAELEGNTGDASESGEKRKRYESSDDPMNLWRPLMQRFLDELLRHEGLEDNTGLCSCCQTNLGRGAQLFRCLTCGAFTQCLTCVLSRHASSPLHRLQEWTGHFWTVVSLASLGSVYQLGHGGHPCPRPAPTVRTMVVIDTEYIHTSNSLRNGWYPATTVDPATCATFASLELFRLLNVVGNINVNDFVGTLERRTSALAMKSVPDRYKAFGRMARQYAFLKRLKRAGRGHDPHGLPNTKNGECAVMCWACPHDGVNLPEGWREVSPEFRFLYMLILAMDANFRLKNRLRGNQHEDAPLASGWGVFGGGRTVQRTSQGICGGRKTSAPALHLRVWAGWFVRDMSWYGLKGWATCKRGERYANMDYILLSAVLGVTALYLTISYDIACQWRINLPKRMAALPECLRLDLLAVTVMFGLPNSLSYTPRVGRTDGEGIERTWSHLNPLGWATKEMNIGARHDAIEDKVDHWNLRRTLIKLILAIDERDRQVNAFKQVDSTVKKVVRKEWQRKIDEWHADRSKPNPYRLLEGMDGGPGEAAIRRSLAQDEAQEAAMGGTSLSGSSVTSFLTAGLQLEETQRRIRAEAKGRKLLVADQSQRVAEMRFSFFSKLAKFRKLQEIYMPGAVKELQEDEEARDCDLPPPNAEDVKLYLPSALRSSQKEQACTKGLPAMEARLREGQCRDALRAATKSQTLIGQIGERVDAAAAKYRRARLALIALRGRDACERFRELTAADIQLDEEREIDARARKKLGSIGSARPRRLGPTFREGPALSSKERHMSWIWTEGGGPGKNEKELHDSVRVEWSQAKARKERWEEEVDLLREEMKRVLRFLRWQGIWWEERRKSRREGVSAELRGGLEAYAARQAAGARAMSRRFKTAWDASAATAVRMAIAEDAVLVQAMSAFTEAERRENTAEDALRDGREASDTLGLAV
ncbi:CxC2 domain-containing protein [Mycena sanguinolenta]|uniref:CxC2 domain-containing protein n=1 Tax=Mycena sanguinolenta TaxID=230812 RepID=A0A8H7DHF5_9AGAR|nr:CxC2 domain-containing protein [Mycena sanguinolenta]